MAQETSVAPSAGESQGMPVRTSPPGGRLLNPLLLAPALLLLLAVFIAPLVRILGLSFGEDTWSLDHYRALFADDILLAILVRTLWLSVTVSVLCLLLGYPVAYLMLRSSETLRRVIALLVILPLWTSLLVRTYAWIVVLGRKGLVNESLMALGLTDAPMTLLYNRTSVYIGMVHVMLPFMVLPLYAVMRRIDLRLVSAACSLGASRSAAFFFVFLPLSLPGVLAGSLLVFILAIGFFVTPALLGGLSDTTFVMLIERQVNRLFNWPLAAAMSVTLLVATLALVALYNRLLAGQAGESRIAGRVLAWLLRSWAAATRPFGGMSKKSTMTVSAPRSGNEGVGPLPSFDDSQSMENADTSRYRSRRPARAGGPWSRRLLPLRSLRSQEHSEVDVGRSSGHPSSAFPRRLPSFLRHLPSFPRKACPRRKPGRESTSVNESRNSSSRRPRLPRQEHSEVDVGRSSEYPSSSFPRKRESTSVNESRKSRFKKLRLRLPRPSFVGVTAWAVLFFMVAPITIVFPLAFSDAPFLQFPPPAYSTRWFENYFSRPDWVRPMITSFEVAVVTMVFATAIGTLAAISVVRGSFRGKKAILALLLAPLIVPIIVLAVAFYYQFARYGIIGTRTGLILAHTVLAIPYVVIVVSAALERIDTSLEHAAWTLGAGRITAFWKVSFPLIRPAVIVAALFAFLASFDELVVAIFISGTRATTLPKRMWDGIREEIDPTTAAVAVLLIALSMVLLSAAEVLRRRGRRAGVEVTGGLMR